MTLCDVLRLLAGSRLQFLQSKPTDFAHGPLPVFDFCRFASRCLIESVKYILIGRPVKDELHSPTNFYYIIITYCACRTWSAASTAYRNVHLKAKDQKKPILSSDLLCTHRFRCGGSICSSFSLKAVIEICSGLFHALRTTTAHNGDCHHQLTLLCNKICGVLHITECSETSKLLTKGELEVPVVSLST